MSSSTQQPALPRLLPSPKLPVSPLGRAPVKLEFTERQPMLATSCRPTGHKPRSTLRLVKLARAADLEAVTYFGD